MKLFIGYATSEGQSRKIMRHVADRSADGGHGVELMAVTDGGGVDLGRFDAAILSGSLHAGHYQRALSEFASENATALNKMPTLFLSISLAAAGHDAEDWRHLDHILADFTEATGWTPTQTAQIAGAYRPAQYDIFRRFVMRRIIALKEPDADLDVDIEYTDWPALDALVDEWMRTHLR